jgi:hypothetical protein
MQPVRKAILAGAAAIALVAVAGLAVAEIKNAHRLDVRLPDGLVADIRYVGDTPPTVSFTSVPMARLALSPASDPFGPDSPFAALERISEAMDRQAAAMFQEVNAQSALALTPPDLRPVDVGTLPRGASGFSMVSTMSGNGLCTRSIQYRSLGEDKPPQVVTRASGACTADQRRPALSVTSGSSAETSKAT